MKKRLQFRFLFLMCLIALFFFTNTAISHAEVNYIGEFCFTMVSDDPTVALKTVQLGVLSYGEGHFPLYGKATIEGFDGVIPIHGTGVINGDAISITLNASDRLTLSRVIYIEITAGASIGGYTEIVQAMPFMGAPIPPQIFTNANNGAIHPIACPQ